MLIDDIRTKIARGMAIPKPEAKAAFLMKGWGIRRGEAALIYSIPNHKSPANVLSKGITISEFEKAFTQMTSSGELTRACSH